MYYLIIDTCVWITACQSYPNLVDKISTLIRENKVSLILPTIIYEEWLNHREKTVIDSKIVSVKGMIKNTKQIKVYLSDEDSKIIDNIISNISDDKIKKEILRPINTVEALFSHLSTTRIEITDSSKLKSVDTAISNKKPFAKNKNSIKDALILFSSMEYAEDNGILSDCIFITENTSDFSDDKDKNKPHPDISDFFSDSKAKYFINLGEAINHIEEGLVDDAEVIELREEIKYKEIESRFATTYGLPSELLAARAINRDFIDSISGNSVSKMFEKEQKWSRDIIDSVSGNSLSKMFEEEQKWIRNSYGLSSVADLTFETLNKGFIDNITGTASASVFKPMTEQQHSITSLATSGFAEISAKIFEEEQKRNRDFINNITGTVSASAFKFMEEQQNSIASLVASDFTGLSAAALASETLNRSFIDTGNSVSKMLEEEQKRIRDSYGLSSAAALASETLNRSFIDNVSSNSVSKMLEEEKKSRN